jgi:hypothetical protein
MVLRLLPRVPIIDVLAVVKHMKRASDMDAGPLPTVTSGINHARSGSTQLIKYMYDVGIFPPLTYSYQVLKIKPSRILHSWKISEKMFKKAKRRGR